MLRGELAKTAVRAEWAMGGPIPRDFIWTTIAAPILVSTKVQQLLGQIDATGWSSSPVAVQGPNRTDIGGYAALAVTGRCGPINAERSVAFEKRYPAGKFVAYRGWFFEEATWDGSDLFMPSDGSGHVFVHERIRSALVEANVTGVEFQRADLIERSTRD